MKTTTLERGELLRRYLLHVLPAGLMRIRHYWFISGRYKQKNLDLIRRLLRAAPVIRKVKPAENYIEQMRRVTGKELDQCKVCK
ncbi:MAG: transposase [Pseudomonadales bacterium]|nr:transposase [Pseudomonadales bacterium]